MKTELIIFNVISSVSIISFIVLRLFGNSLLLTIFAIIYIVYACAVRNASAYYTTDEPMIVPVGGTLINCSRQVSRACSRGTDLDIIPNVKQSSSGILQNIFPNHIIDMVKNNDYRFIEKIHNVSIIFSDIINFTPWSERNEPNDIYRALNIIYSEYDKLTEKYGIYKIETVGDAYMAVSGYPTYDENHAYYSFLFANGILESLPKLNKQIADLGINFTVSVRVGIAMGNVAAGLIGKLKPHLNFVGDVVNTAARMEQNCYPNRIHVTEAIAKHLKDFGVHCESRGYIDIKGKGPMKTYFAYKKKLRKLSVSSPIMVNLNDNPFLLPNEDLIRNVSFTLSNYGMHYSIANKLVIEIKDAYNDTPYHNFLHVYCVVQMCYKIISETELKETLSDNDKLILLVSCLGHDLGHDGTNASYHIKSFSKVFLDYGHESFLEKFHYYGLYKIINALIINGSASDFASDVVDDELHKMKCLFSNPKTKECIRELILATDLSKHELFMTQITELKTANVFSGRYEKLLLMKLIIKTSDLSNELRNREVANEWLKKLEMEYVKQAKLEQEHKHEKCANVHELLNDRRLAQISFLLKFVCPLVLTVSNVLDYDLLKMKAEQSLDYWRNKYVETDIVHDNREIIESHVLEQLEKGNMIVTIKKTTIT